MKIYARTQNNEGELELLAEACLVAEPDTLRELASFLYRCADELEGAGDEWEQEYFDCNDVVCPQIAVFNPALVEQGDSGFPES